MLPAQMENLPENEVSDNVEDTVGGDSNYEGSFTGKGTDNPGDLEFIARARIVFLAQNGDKMRLVYVVEVHVDGGGGSRYYTVSLKGTHEKETEGYCVFTVTSDTQENISPTEPHKAPSNTTSKRSQAEKDRQAEKAYLK
jgi:hypothetical protein